MLPTFSYDVEPNNALESKGKLTVDTLPAADDTITIGYGDGQIVYTFVDSGDFDAEGEIPITAGDLAATQLSIVAAINGTDGVNDAHTQVEAGEFVSNVSIIQALTPGIEGDLIETLSSFTTATNKFDHVTLGQVLHGLNGRVGVLGDFCYYLNNVYSLIANNTKTGKNWRKFLLVDPSYGGSFTKQYTFYVDGSRSDNYIEDGTYLYPYKKISSAQDAINEITKTLMSSEANYDTAKFVMNIAPGKYTDDIDINTSSGQAKYIRYNMVGVEISGKVNITQNQAGVSDYYSKVEFCGSQSSYTEKGRCSRITGDITFLKTAYDSLSYDAFCGIEITGDIKYGAAAGEGHGTWVLHLENTSFPNTAKSITTNFAAGSHCMLIVTRGYNNIKSSLSGVIDLYEVDGARFRNIDITPANGCYIRNTEFTGTVSIVASKDLKMDLNSMISMYSRTPTLTGMKLLPIDGSAEITIPLTADDIKGMNAAPKTIVEAVTGKVIVIDDIVMKMVRTATAYTGGGAVEFRYTDASGDKVTADIAATVITAAGAATEYAIQKSIITSLTGVVNSPIVITNADAAFADGTGTAVLTIRYHLV